MDSASQTIKQIPFREQEDLCTIGQEDSCACNVASDDVFTSEGASGSPGPSFPRDHHLGVGVATAHSIVTLKMAVHIPFPKLAHFHVLMLVDLPLNRSKNLEVGCVWNHKI